MLKTVERGISLLDERVPGWEKYVDPDTLDLSSSCKCVVGQLYRGKHPRSRARYMAYTRGLVEIGIDPGKGATFGFTTWGSGSFENLTRAWAGFIRRRKSEEVS